MMRRADLICAALFVALGLATIFVIIPRYVTGSALGGDLSPAFMPYVAAVLATVAAALLFAGTIRRRARADEPGDEPTPLPKASWIFVATTAGVLAATFALMSAFGYLAGAAAIVAGFMGIARASVRVVVGAAVTFPVVLWLLFDRLLGFPLP